MTVLGDRLGYFVRGSTVMLRDPAAGVERVRGRLQRRADRRAFLADGRPIEEVYPVDPEWLCHLHEAMGWPWPCPDVAEAEGLRAEIRETFRRLGLPPTYDDWCDGGDAFTTAAYCLALHLVPRTVVETGIARGVTSRLLLEALARTGSGHLHSIDLPALDSGYHSQIAIAVPAEMRAEWTVRMGTSRRELPPLLRTLGSIDLFVHDSQHTGRNTSFELQHALAVLRPGGALLVDDVYQSLAFRHFLDATALRWSSIGANSDGSYMFGIAISRS